MLLDDADCWKRAAYGELQHIEEEMYTHAKSIRLTLETKRQEGPIRNVLLFGRHEVELDSLETYAYNLCHYFRQKLAMAATSWFAENLYRFIKSTRNFLRQERYKMEVSKDVPPKEVRLRNLCLELDLAINTFGWGSPKQPWKDENIFEKSCRFLFLHLERYRERQKLSQVSRGWLPHVYADQERISKERETTGHIPIQVAPNYFGLGYPQPPPIRTRESSSSSASSMSISGGHSTPDTEEDYAYQMIQFQMTWQLEKGEVYEE